MVMIGWTPGMADAELALLNSMAESSRSIWHPIHLFTQEQADVRSQFLDSQLRVFNPLKPA
jgi:hypothetical protein